MADPARPQSLHDPHTAGRRIFRVAAAATIIVSGALPGRPVHRPAEQ